MTDLINTKLSVKLPFYTFQGKTSIVEKQNQINKNNDKKLLLPLGLLAGGGLLIYLGIRRPDVNSVFKKITKAHSIEIEKEPPLYYEKVEKSISEFLNNSLEKIYQYKQQRLKDISERVVNPQTASNVKDIITKQNEAFSAIDFHLNPNRQFGANEFDRYYVQMSSDLLKIRDKLAAERYQSKLKMNDQIQINSSQEFINSVGLKKYNDALAKAQYTLRENIEQLLNEKINYSVNFQSKVMTNIITEIRDLLVETKGNIITSSFNKMSEFLNLKNFKPSYNKTITIKNFKQLTEQELNPIKLSNELEEMFEGNIYIKAIKDINFNTVSKSKLEQIFAQTKSIGNIRDIKFMIDRIRLLNEAQKSQGINNEKIYKNTIAKLEYLYVKLKNIGEQEFLTHCNQKFSTMSKEQFKAKIYAMNKISRALGYHTLTQANRNFIRKYPNYSKTQFKKSAELIYTYPEDFFM